MAARTLGGIGLTGGYDLDEDGWKDSMNKNLLVLSNLVQGGVIGTAASVPGTPVAGDAYILTSAPNQYSIAVYDNGAWTYISPLEGMLVYNHTTHAFWSFEGGVWGPYTAIGGLPSGGATGQVLTKLSATNQDAGWIDPTGGGGSGGSGPHRYWMVRLLSAAGDSNISVAEMILATTTGGTRLTVATAAAYPEMNGGSALLFDNNPSTFAYSTGCAVVMDLGVGVTEDVKEVRLKTRDSGFTTQTPTLIELLSSNDGSKFVSLGFNLVPGAVATSGDTKSFEY